MNETWVTLVGNVVAEPRTTVLADGTFLASFRLASTSRRYDRASQGWRDQDTVYVTVLCWRQLGENVADSVFRGAPVLVTGRLGTKTYDSRTGERRLAVEVEAAAVGLDLNRGKGSLFRGNRARLAAAANGASAAPGALDGAAAVPAPPNSAAGADGDPTNVAAPPSEATAEQESPEQPQTVDAA